MIGEEWQVQVVQDFASMTNKVYVYRYVNNQKTVFLVDEGRRSVEVDNGAAEDGEPRHYTSFYPDLIYPLLQALESRNPLPSKERVDGELTATRRHLADVRHLLKLPGEK